MRMTFLCPRWHTYEREGTWSCNPRNFCGKKATQKNMGKWIWIILLNSIMTIQKNSCIMEPYTSNEPWVFCEYLQKWDSWFRSSLSLCQASNQSVLHGQLRIGALQQFRQFLPPFGSRVGRDVQMGVVVLCVVERWYGDTQERSLVSVVHCESRLPLIDTNSSRVLQLQQANHSGSSHHSFKWLGFQVEWPSKQGLCQSCHWSGYISST